jgi:hypothetical protein
MALTMNRVNQAKIKKLAISILIPEPLQATYRALLSEITQLLTNFISLLVEESINK